MHDTLFAYMIELEGKAKIVRLDSDEGGVMLMYSTLQEAQNPELIKRIQLICDLNKVTIELCKLHKLETLQIFHGKGVQTH